MEGQPTVAFEPIFSDVAAGRWYADAVVWAANNGIVAGIGGGRLVAMQWAVSQGLVRGTPAGLLSPQGTATRAECAAVLMQFVGEHERLHAPFVLTISVEETNLPQGEDFVVNVELKNNSREDQTIGVDVLFWSHIPD